MKTVWLISIFLLGSIALRAQGGRDTSFHLVRSFTGDIAGATMDNLGNLYLLSSKGQVKKYNASGDSAGLYNQVRNFGKLTTLDASNPLKLLLFYKDFSTIVVLDRFLAPVATLDLRSFNILQAGAVGLSYDNNIWVFDEYDNRLRKIDETGKVLLETADFRNVFPDVIRPQQILNADGLVYLADSAQGIYVFDNYGTFKRKLPLVQWQSLSVYKSRIVSTGANWLAVYDPNTFREQRRQLYFEPYLHSFTHNNKLITFDKEKLRIYEFFF